MRYLGIARKENGQVLMPEGFQEVEEGRIYEALEIGGDILLISSPCDRERLTRIESLTKQSIEEHRRSLENLAR